MATARMRNLANRLSNLAPGVEAITLMSRQPTQPQTTFVAWDVQRARRRLLTREEVLDRSLDMFAGKQLMVWEIWVTYLDGGPDPKVSDSIIDQNGDSWTIVSPVKFLYYKQLFSCMCQHQAP